MDRWSRDMFDQEFTRLGGSYAHDPGFMVRWKDRIALEHAFQQHPTLERSQHERLVTYENIGEQREKEKQIQEQTISQIYFSNHQAWAEQKAKYQAEN